ncbi:hypothetical protein H8356DRAFT_1696920 [Neocallimastix lanati (nom. inval.)]|jgi:hypothetical protein|nr:hypothetical protein H8356DRAFT_1696920 [Neocallimastix sp. JGI-2020a]
MSDNNGEGKMPNLHDLPYVARIEILYKPNIKVESILLALFIILYVPSTIMYIKNKNHPFIKYRQPKMVILGAILSGFVAILIPIIRMAKISCFVNTWINSSAIYGFLIVTFTRYAKIYFIQKLSIFKLKFSEKNNKSIHDKGDFSMKSIIGKPKDVGGETSISIKTSSIRSSTLTHDSGTSNDVNTQSLNSVDPTTYFKRLDSIIKLKISIYFIALPMICLFTYYIVITINKFDTLKKPCPNEIKDITYPKLATNIFIFISSIFMFYQIYFKQKWDREFKLEYTTFVIVQLTCNILINMTTKGKLNDTIASYRIYIFQMFSFSVQLLCVYEPLIKIFYTKHWVKESKLTQEEFLNKLSNTSFREQVKDIATHTFCIENLLFIEAHNELMNIVLNYYSKKNNPPAVECITYNSSDVLHKNTISPILYKPFEPIFKPYFEKIYDLYIKEDGIACVNVKASTIRTIENQMENDNYSYLMFLKAAEEVGELLYNNVNAKLYVH